MSGTRLEGGGCSGDLDQNGSPDVVVTTGPWTGGPGGAVTVLMHRPPAPVTIRVPDDVPSIGEAVAISVDGDTIEVGPGTWHEQVDVQGRAVVLTATSGPEHATLQGVGGEVIRAVSGESAATVFEGFTIRGGTGFEGGGAYISNGSPTFRRCRFIGNNATYGSGLYVVAPGALSDQGQYCGAWCRHLEDRGGRDATRLVRCD